MSQALGLLCKDSSHGVVYCDRTQQSVEVRICKGRERICTLGER